MKKMKAKLSGERLNDGDRVCNVVDNMIANTSHYHPVAGKRNKTCHNMYDQQLHISSHEDLPNISSSLL